MKDIQFNKAFSWYYCCKKYFWKVVFIARSVDRFGIFSHTLTVHHFNHLPRAANWVLIGTKHNCRWPQINFSERRWVLFKKAAKNITSKKRELPKSLGPLIKIAWPLTKNVLAPLGKSVLVSLRLNATRLGSRTTIIEIAKSPEDSGLLTKVINKIEKLKMK